MGNAGEWLALWGLQSTRNRIPQLGAEYDSMSTRSNRAPVRAPQAVASRGTSSTARMMTIIATDIGRCRNTMALPSPIETALRNWASASGPRIMPTTTGAVGKS